MPTCTTASLSVACFRGYNLTRLQKLAFKIWYAANQLKAIGGTDYTAILAKPAAAGGKSLLNDAIQQFARWDMNALDSAIVAIEYNNAVAAGASVSAVPNTVQSSVSRLEAVDENDLLKMYAELKCQLGRAKAYPQ